MIIDTMYSKHSFIGSAGYHYAERISCKTTEIRKLQICGAATTGECLYLH